jgi:hypothetical protein
MTIRIAAHRNLDYALSKSPELARELRVGQAIAGAAANIEEALQCAESDFAVCRAFECQMGRLDQVKEVFCPNIHFTGAGSTTKDARRYR